MKYKWVTSDIAFDAQGDIEDGALTWYTYKMGMRELLQVLR
jgi:branched-chain amino acid transport system substrate-binding protein